MELQEVQDMPVLKENVVNLESLATQVNLDNQEILVVPVHQENLDFQEDLEKMA